MNIALVILHADPARGGAERYTVDLAAALIARGHAVSLLAQDFAETLPTTTRVQLGRAKGGTRFGRYARFCDDLDRHLGDTHYDIVHAMLPVRQCDIYHPHAGIAAEARRNWFNRRRRRFATTEGLLLTGPRPPIALCLSRYVERALCKHYTIAPQRTRILLNGVDLRRFDPAIDPQTGQAVRQRFGITDGKIVALIIAQDFVRKGLIEVIRALAVINDPRMVVVAVGKQDPSPYREYARINGTADRVIFPGPCADPRPFYQSADFFVLPTRHDPCSLVVLEALAMGLPVITTATNGASEALVSGRHGFVIADDTDRTNLEVSMRKLLDESPRREMAEACLALRPRLSYDHHVDRLLEIYAEAADRGAAGA